MTEREAHDIFKHAALARMSPIAYAIHTNRARELYGTTLWRAFSDHEFCQEVLEKNARAKGKRYRRSAW